MGEIAESRGGSEWILSRCQIGMHPIKIACVELRQWSASVDGDEARCSGVESNPKSCLLQAGAWWPVATLWALTFCIGVACHHEDDQGMPPVSVAGIVGGPQVVLLDVPGAWSAAVGIPGPTVVFALWSSGIVFLGGQTHDSDIEYRSGTIPVDDARRMIDTISADVRSISGRVDYRAPDAGYIALFVRVDDEYRSLLSMHDVAATDMDDSEYVRFLRVMDAAIGMCTSVDLRDGHLVSSELLVIDERWHEW